MTNHPNRSGNDKRLHGSEAIEYAIENGLNLNKYADPTEDATYGLSISEARAIAQEDPGLIWVETYDPTDAASRETHERH